MLSAYIVAPATALFMGPTGPADERYEQQELGASMDNVEPPLMSVFERTFEYSYPSIEMNLDLGTMDVRVDGLRNLDEPGAPSVPVESVSIAILPDMVPVSIEVTAVEGAVTLALGKNMTPGPTVTGACSIDGYDILAYEKGAAYSTDALFPGTLVRHGVSFGLTGPGEDGRDSAVLSSEIRSRFIDIELFPVQYEPVSGQLIFHPRLDLKLTYAPSPTSAPVRARAPTFDMVIVTPQVLVPAYQVLSDHHNTTGVVTRVVAFEDVLAGTYFTAQGADNAEKLKYFIKSAIEGWGISFLLIGGDSNNMPVRMGAVDFGFASWATDYYFADIYKSDGSFASWNANGDAEWGEFSSDMSMIDLRADVNIGRLPSANLAEAQNMIAKIRNYDNTTVGESWFFNVTIVTDLPEGEPYGNHLVDTIYKASDGWNAHKLYGVKATLANFSQPQNHSVGVVAFWGHGGPTAFLAADYINVSDINTLTNFDRLPIVTAMACDCGQFETTANSWGESWVKNPNGGGISALAGTQTSNSNNMDDMAGATNRMFHESNKNHTLRKIGEMYSVGMGMYVDFEHPKTSSLDYKNMVQYVLFGDPATYIGGYSRTHAQISANETQLSALPGQTVSFNISLEDTGTGYADMNITAKRPDSSPFPAGWNISLPYNFTQIKAGENRTIQLNVTPPQNASTGESLEVAFKAVSPNCPESPFDILTKTTVATNYTFTIGTQDPHKDVAADRMVNYSFTVNNTGNAPFKFAFGVPDIPANWSFTWSTPEVTILMAGSAQVTLSLTPGHTVVAGYYPMTVRCNLTELAGMVKDIAINTTVLPANGITLTPLNGTLEVEEEESVLFNVSVENLGNHPERVSFSFPNESALIGWQLKVGPADFVDIGAFQTIMMTVNTTAPMNVLAGDYTMTLETKLASDGTSRWLDLVATVAPYYYFSITYDENDKQGSALETASFDVTITNFGNIEDTYDMSIMHTPDGWSASLEEETLTLQPRDAFTMAVEVTIGELPLGGSNNVTWKIMAVGMQFNMSTHVTVDIPVIRAVALLSNTTTIEAAPGTIVPVQLTVQNLGNVPDTFDMNIEGPQGWFVADVQDITMDAYGNMLVQVDVTVPADAKAGPKKVTFTAASLADAAKTATLDITFDVERIVDLEVGPATITVQNATAGGLSTFSYDLRNLGNDKDTFTATVNGLPSGWKADTEGSVDLDANGTYSGKVTLTVPDGAAEGDVVLRLVLTSKGDPTKKGEIPVTVHVAKKEKGARSTSTLGTPFLMAILVIVIIAVLAVAMLMMRKNKGKKDVQMAPSTPSPPPSSTPPPEEPKT